MKDAKFGGSLGLRRRVSVKLGLNAQHVSWLEDEDEKREISGN